MSCQMGPCGSAKPLGPFDSLAISQVMLAAIQVWDACRVLRDGVSFFPFQGVL